MSFTKSFVIMSQLQWIRAGKRSFQMMMDESTTVQQMAPAELVGATDEIDLPFLANVPEDVLRHVFPPSKRFQLEHLRQYLEVLMYLRFPLDGWLSQVNALATREHFDTQDVLHVVDAFQLFLTTKPSKQDLSQFQNLLRVCWEKLDPAQTNACFREIQSRFDRETEIQILPAFYRQMYDRPNAILRLLDMHRYVPYKGQCMEVLKECHPWIGSHEKPYTFHRAEIKETGPCAFDVFLDRFTAITHGIAEHKEIKPLLNERRIAFAGEVVAHCLSERQQPFDGRAVAIFVAITINEKPREVMRRVLTAFERFTNDAFPGKRVYYIDKSDNDVWVRVEDSNLKFTFYTIASELKLDEILEWNLAFFTVGYREVMFDGCTVQTSFTGLCAWMTRNSWISPKVENGIFKDAYDSGFDLHSSRDIAREFEKSRSEYMPPLSILPIDYNIKLIKADLGMHMQVSVRVETALSWIAETISPSP